MTNTKTKQTTMNDNTFLVTPVNTFRPTSVTVEKCIIGEKEDMEGNALRISFMNLNDVNKFARSSPMAPRLYHRRNKDLYLNQVLEEDPDFLKIPELLDESDGDTGEDSKYLNKGEKYNKSSRTDPKLKPRRKLQSEKLVPMPGVLPYFSSTERSSGQTRFLLSFTPTSE